MKKIKSLKNIIESNLCVGCGLCSYITNHKIKMIDIENEGKRPDNYNNLTPDEENDIVNCCPGISLNTSLDKKTAKKMNNNEILIGPTIKIYEGWAKNKEIRFNASSGGIISALAIYCLEMENMKLILHTGKDTDFLWKNKTIVSKTKKEIINNSGSRYCPSSPCELLDIIENSDKKCVFIGKPCDVAAVSNIRKIRPKLDKNLGLVLSFICAGTPNTKATLSLIEKLKINKKQINDLYYRGKGWPGDFTINYNTNKNKKLSYDNSWGYLASKSRQLRCHLCPDGLSEFSDITSGDAWHRKHEKNNIGCSLILVRTENGLKFIQNAYKNGYIEIVESNSSNAVKAQGLVERRKLIAPRLFGLKIMGKPIPSYKNFYLLRASSMISIITLFKNFLGMIKRILINNKQKL